MDQGAGLIDIRTLILSIVLMEVFISMIMMLYWRRRGGYSGFDIWALALIVFAGAHTSIILRGIIPDVISIFSTNLLSIIGFLLLYDASSRFCVHKPIHRAWYLCIPLILIGVIIGFFIIDSIAIRTIFTAAIASILSFQIARMFYLDTTDRQDIFSKILIVSFIILAFIFILRIVDYSTNMQDRELLQSSLSTDFLFLFSVFAAIGSTLLFIIINFDRLSQERDHQTAQIQKLADKYDLAIKTAGAGVWEMNLDTKKLYLDEQVFRMLGKEKSGAMDKAPSLQDIIHPEDLPRLIRTIEGVSSEGQEVREEYRVLKQDGEIRYHISTAKSYKSDEGQGLRLIGMSIDITQLRQTQNALKRAMNKLSILSSITRHDILNSVTVITMTIYLFMDTILDPAVQKRLQVINESAEKITHLINFTASYENLGLYEPEWTDLVAILKRESIQQMLEGFVVVIPERGVEIFVDQMVEKVLYNLIDNSIRHGGEVTRISLEYQTDGKDLLIIYSDDGNGVAPEDKERLFEQGFGKNTGLGLFLSREILALTDISISEEGRPGEGARFVMRVKQGAYRNKGEEGGVVGDSDR